MKENEAVVENPEVPVTEEEVQETQETAAEEAQVPAESVEEEQTEAAEEGVLDDDALSQIDGMKKHDAAVLIIEKTRHIVDGADKQMEACRMLLNDDLQAYESAKEALQKEALDESESLLKHIGFEEEELPAAEEVVVFEAKEERPPFYVQDISSGKFGSFVLSLIVGAGTLAGFAYFAASKMGVAIDPSKVPSVETLKSLASWYGTLINGKEDLMVGGGAVGLVTLLIMWIVYSVRVSGKATRNLAFAKQQLEEAQEYAVYKGDCKTEMDKVDAHMNDAIATLKTYAVLLEEQNGKLKRIVHIEGVKEDPAEYHANSQAEMQEAQALVDSVGAFIATPMSEAGKLSAKSVALLENAKAKLQQIIEKRY